MVRGQALYLFKEVKSWKPIVQCFRNEVRYHLSIRRGSLTVQGIFNTLVVWYNCFNGFFRGILVEATSFINEGTCSCLDYL